MNQHESTRFFKALGEMGLMFSDELTKPRQRLYWEVFRDTCTIDEWEYATHEAMLRETFHKVPLPAALLDYVKECRRKEREQRLQDQCAEGVKTRETLLQIREELVPSEEVRHLIASVFPEDAMQPRTPHRHPKIRLSDEDLRYEPTVDPEIAKQKAREQLRQLAEEEQSREEGA